MAARKTAKKTKKRTTKKTKSANQGSLDGFLGAVNKAIGKQNPDIVFDPNRHIEFIPTGVYAYDLVSGGGFPRRRITEIYGWEQSGKSAVCQSALGVCNERGFTAIYIDAEGGVDPVLCTNVYKTCRPNDPKDSRFALIQTDNGEQVCDVLDVLLNDNTEVDLIVVDSIDACKPQSIIEGAAEKEQRVGAMARLVGLMTHKCRQLAKKKNCAIVFVNQIRSKIQSGRSTEQNTGTGAGYNVTESSTTPGGWAPRFYSSIRVKMEYGGRIYDEDGKNEVTGDKEKLRIGHNLSIVNIKNRIRKPFLKVKAPFIFPDKDRKTGGWDNIGFMMEVLKKRGHLSRTGIKFQYQGLKKDFEHKGAKGTGEQIFRDTPELVEDGFALMHMLLSEQGLEVATKEEIGEDTGQEIDPDSLSDDVISTMDEFETVSLDDEDLGLTHSIEV